MALRVGIIGLGKIGRACASNLIADGFTVCALRVGPARPTSSIMVATCTPIRQSSRRPVT